MTEHALTPDSPLLVTLVTPNKKSLLEETYRLSLDKQAQFNCAAAAPPHKSWPAWQAAEYMIKLGAKMQDGIAEDGTVLPAYKCVHRKTGRTVQIKYMQDNQPHDPPSGEAAMQSFSSASGHACSLYHAQNGALQDTASGEPATQDFDPDSGKIKRLSYIRNGTFKDPVPGIPAIQYFDTTGKLTSAQSCPEENSQLREVSAKEISALNAVKGSQQGVPRPA